MSRLSLARFFSSLFVYCYFRHFHRLTMTPPADDTLVLPASTTVKVANKLLDILNTTLGDLSEPELLVVRSDLKDSLLLTDRLLSDMEIVSALESFSMADGA